MVKRYYILFVFAFAALLLPVGETYAQADAMEGRMKVSMRMIGHEILLSLGDSTSRVLPIENVGNRYQIQFENDFEFHPEALVAIIDSVAEQTQMPPSYLVEVEQCDSNQIVYSYEKGQAESPDIIPCRGRAQPMGCYSLFITLLHTQPMVFMQTASTTPPIDAVPKVPETTYLQYSGSILFIVFLGFIVAWWLYLRKKNSATINNPDIITIGAYQFDKRNMELLLNNDKMELTGKEAELLMLLHNSANTTLEREVILKTVWGDEGDYIGRTLDVFISKLRKKLEADSSLRIVNIRGIGYKLIMND